MRNAIALLGAVLLASAAYAQHIPQTWHGSTGSPKDGDVSDVEIDQSTLELVRSKSGHVKIKIKPTVTPGPSSTPTPTLTVGPTNCDIGADGSRNLVCLSPTVTPSATLSPTPTITVYPTTLPTAACDEAVEVGQRTVDADGTVGQTAATCTDLTGSSSLVCWGGTNDGATCTVASQCPSGWCTRYAWVLPSIRIGTSAPGVRCERIANSSDFSVSAPVGSNGACTFAANGTLMHSGDVFGSGQVPGNIQPTPITANPAANAAGGKYLGPNNEVTYGYSTQKYCFGGTNANATCSSDTACPGGVCQDFEVHDGKPGRFDDGIALGNPLKVADASTGLKTGTSAWGYDNNGSDLVTSAKKPRLANKSADRTIDKICWYTNAPGATLALQRTGGTAGTPIPTPALPTPSGMATPGYTALDAGCVTGLAVSWPKDSTIEAGYTQATGVQWSLVVVSWSVTP